MRAGASISDAPAHEVDDSRLERVDVYRQPLFLAGAIAAAVAGLVTKVMGDTPTGKLVASVAPILIMGIAVSMILNQLGIAPAIVTITYAVLLGSLGLGMALAFGLGGRETAARKQTRRTPNARTRTRKTAAAKTKDWAPARLAAFEDPTAERCGCTRAYQAWVYSVRDHKKITRTFSSLSEAKAWRADALGAVRRRVMRAPTKITLREAASSWLAGAKDGSIRDRAGGIYKPSTVRAYEAALEKGVLDEFGSHKLSEISRLDLQDFADRLLAAGAHPSTIQGRLMPVRAVFRRALARGDLGVNPTSGLTLPAVRGGRDRVASPEEAAQLVAALAREHRALWATALYAGLRRGELMALRWRDVDVAGGVIRVERGWDALEGPISPKSVKGRRRVPIAAVLRDHLLSIGSASATSTRTSWPTGSCSGSTRSGRSILGT